MCSNHGLPLTCLISFHFTYVPVTLTFHFLSLGHSMFISALGPLGFLFLTGDLVWLIPSLHPSFYSKGCQEDSPCYLIWNNLQTLCHSAAPEPVFFSLYHVSLPEITSCIHLHFCLTVCLNRMFHMASVLPDIFFSISSVPRKAPAHSQGSIGSIKGPPKNEGHKAVVAPTLVVPWYY